MNFVQNLTDPWKNITVAEWVFPVGLIILSINFMFLSIAARVQKRLKFVKVLLCQFACGNVCWYKKAREPTH